MSGVLSPSDYYFKDGLWTYDGSVWRPQNQLLAYRDTLRLVYSNNDAAAGAVTYDFTAVPAGEVHVITTAYLYDATTATVGCEFDVVSSGTAYPITTTYYDTVKQTLHYVGSLVIKAGENLRAGFYSCVLHDVLRAFIHGYKFKIAE